MLVYEPVSLRWKELKCFRLLCMPAPFCKAYRAMLSFTSENGNIRFVLRMTALDVVKLSLGCRLQGARQSVTSWLVSGPVHKACRATR